MWFILALLSAVVFGFSSFFMKVNSFWQLPLMPFLTGLYTSGSLGFFGYALMEGTLHLSLAVLLGGVMVGAGSAFGNLLYMKALNVGPASLSSPLVNTNILLIVLLGLFVYGEQIGAVQYAGIGLIMAAIAILPLDPKENFSIKSRAWYGFILTATLFMFFRNGGLKITEEAGLENTPVLLAGYLLGMVYSLYGWHRKKQQQARSGAPVHTGKAFSWGLVTGIFSFGGMQLYAAALREGPASIVSPLFAAHALLVAVLSMLYLQERITRYQAVILAVVLIEIVFLRL
ncbi:hypothetical protein CHL76_16270 [Marinococcus halophilus]|uniref:EamA domain-containing protein n=1 Tax=Marinococcus halophilus TaxID=1371 RepID=A0A510YD47_MARHA|nr:DMT family transporter [Marinococcus halophilus]OZT78760.1 hypothetical protein CHL76_16270 [Marinococcus halophilus]GEK60277.1 hypothetical protein MHA01_31820 [Marinococcus halophilus]